jgi:regulator of RNase E activity RraA
MFCKNQHIYRSNVRPGYLILTLMSNTEDLARTTSKLIDFSTCEISDALIKLKAPHGGYLPDINMLSPSPSSPSASSTRICGPAYTVLMVMSSDVSAPKLSEHFVDTIPQGSVIVISAPPS